MRVYRDGLGHWYTSFVVEAGKEPLPETDRAIGIDWGVSQTATTTDDDYDLPHPEHGKKAQKRLAHYQRMMARRKTSNGKPMSQGYRFARRAAAKVHRQVARRRQDKLPTRESPPPKQHCCTWPENIIVV